MVSRHNWLWYVLVFGLLTSVQLLGQKTAKSAQKRDDVLKRAMQFFNDGKYDSALVHLQRALVLDSSNSGIKYEIALAHSIKHQYDTAIVILESILADSKAKDSYYQLLSNIFSEKEDTVKARTVLEQGAKRFPLSGKMHMELGLLQLQQHKLDEALDEFEEGIQVDPGYLLNYYWAARSYSKGNEKIWTILYSELLMNSDPNVKRLSLTSIQLYNTHLAVFEDFRTSHQMVYSKARKGATDASQVQKISFEEAYNSLMTEGAKLVHFYQDFELPIASIDTLQTHFVKRWYALGYDTLFPNLVIERHKVLLDKGLHTAYTYFLMQFAKPLEGKTFFDNHKKEYETMLRWLKEHPLEPNDKNRFSRFFY